MRIACIGYREWACKIYEEIQHIFPQHEFLILKKTKEFDKSTLENFDPEFILFYGWSWIISEDIIEKFTCVMLHPSPLPKYRGGSPIQNQIIRGVTESTATLFIMDKGIDTGDIVGRYPLSLEGSLDEILHRIYVAGVAMTQDLINGSYNRAKQDHDKSTFYSRRKKRDSEITLEELKTSSADYLYNKVRMLADPYPNAFIKTCDGKKLLIKSVQVVELDNERNFKKE